MHHYIMPSKKKEERKVKALMELIKEGVAEVTATEEKNVNMTRSVILKPCFGGEETQETNNLEEGKHQEVWLLMNRFQPSCICL